MVTKNVDQRLQTIVLQLIQVVFIIAQEMCMLLNYPLALISP